jgi:hypothetical protein
MSTCNPTRNKANSSKKNKTRSAADKAALAEGQLLYDAVHEWFTQPTGTIAQVAPLPTWLARAPVFSLSTCSNCQSKIITVPYYKCLECNDIFCSACVDADELSPGIHPRSHMMVKVRSPLYPRGGSVPQAEYSVGSWPSEQTRRKIGPSGSMMLEKQLKDLCDSLAAISANKTERFGGAGGPDAELTMEKVKMYLEMFVTLASATVDDHVCIAKQEFMGLLPTAYGTTENNMLAEFLFGIYDYKGDDNIDLEEFIFGITLLKRVCSTTYSKVKLAVYLVSFVLGGAANEFKFVRNPKWNLRDPAKPDNSPDGVYSARADAELGTRAIMLDRFFTVLRLLIYAYFDMTKLIFADATAILEQKQLAALPATQTKLIDNVQPEFRNNKKMLYSEKYFFYNDTSDPAVADTRAGYDPIAKDLEVESDINGFQIQNIENEINSIRISFGDATVTTVPLSQLFDAVLASEPISFILVSCVEASLI